MQEFFIFELVFNYFNFSDKCITLTNVLFNNIYFDQLDYDLKVN